LVSVRFPDFEPSSVELVMPVVDSAGVTAVEELLIVCEVVLGTAMEVVSIVPPLPVAADIAMLVAA